MALGSGDFWRGSLRVWSTCEVSYCGCSAVLLRRRTWHSLRFWCCPGRWQAQRTQSACKGEYHLGLEFVISLVVHQLQLQLQFFVIEGGASLVGNYLRLGLVHILFQAGVLLFQTTLVWKWKSLLRLSCRTWAMRRYLTLSLFC